MAMSSLFIPVILGTARKGRRSEHAARFVFEETKRRAGVDTEFVDICKIPMRLDDAGEQMKDPAFSDLVRRADGLILVVPEYNHGYPGLLKHALDMNLEEYIHKAVGICGVSAGPFGGARVVEARAQSTRRARLRVQRRGEFGYARCAHLSRSRSPPRRRSYNFSRKRLSWAPSQPAEAGCLSPFAGQ